MRLHPLLFNFMLIMLLVTTSHHAWANCVDNGAGTYTCTGVSDNTTTQTGNTVLDNSAAPATLNNNEVLGVSRGVIQNDTASTTTGQMQTIEVVGGNGTATVNNTSSAITVDRDDLDTSLFTANSAGILLYNGTQAGIASAIHSDSGTSLLTINNIRGSAFLDSEAAITSEGAYTAAISSNAQQLVINNTVSGEWYRSVISNNSANTATDTLSSGHWAIATYGGATYSAPAILDGTQYATITSSGLTIINNSKADIIGNILVIDKNPLLKAAQEIDSSLALAYSTNDVGPRDSIINNGSGGSISGNIYLGSGAHVINNGIVPGSTVLESASASINGDIYVDQSASAVTSVTGGIATNEYLVAGARTFTLNQGGQFAGNIYINDVAESVNNINVYASYAIDNLSLSDDPNFNVTTNGLGINNLNLYCGRTISSSCQASGSWVGLSTLNVNGNYWGFNDAAQVVDVTGGDINLNAQLVTLGGTMKADNVIVTNLLQGVLGSENIAGGAPSVPDRMGNIVGNLINNGDIVVRDATLTVTGNALFNDNSTFSLRIKSTSNGMLDIVDGSGSGVFTDGSKIILTTKDVYFRTGDTFTVATNSSGTPVIQDSLGIISFTSSDATGDIVLTAKVGIPTELNTNTAGNNAVNLLMDYTGSDAGLVKLQQEIQTLSAEELKRATERLRPEINDSSLRMVMSHTDRVLGVVESHLFDTYLASVKGEPRVPIDGRIPVGAGIWFQGFGGMGTQDSRKNVDGYIATSTGMAAGMDCMIGDNDDLRLGFAGGYAYGNIDNSGITDNNRMNINSYLATVYAAWTPGDWYLNGAVGIARHTYQGERIALGRNAKNEHASMQYTVKLDAGWPILWNDIVTFVPLASFSYSRINEDGYVENGTEKQAQDGGGYNGTDANIDVDSSINLRMDKKTYDSYRSGLGGKVLLSFQQPDYNAGIELRAQYVHEFGDLTNNSVAQFVHGGPVFYSSGIKPANDGILLGSSLRLTGTDNRDQLTLLASYDADVRDKYFGQSLTLMLRYDLDQGPSYSKKLELRKTAARLDSTPKDQLVTASNHDIDAISKAMAPSSTQDMLEFELNSDNPAIRLNAQKKQAVKAAIDNWINAIINGNQLVYFNTYAADFVNDEGLTRPQWERKRKQEMKDGDNAAIRVTDLTIHANGQQASTVFTQTSILGDKQEVVQKIIELEERNGRWLIVSEDSVPLNGWQSAKKF
ncbi:MAG: autotransporter domain-containing protein [Methylophilaceae bacterium]